MEPLARVGGGLAPPRMPLALPPSPPRSLPPSLSHLFAGIEAAGGGEAVAGEESDGGLDRVESLRVLRVLGGDKGAAQYLPIPTAPHLRRIGSTHTTATATNSVGLRGLQLSSHLCCYHTYDRRELASSWSPPNASSGGSHLAIHAHFPPQCMGVDSHGEALKRLPPTVAALIGS